MEQKVRPRVSVIIPALNEASTIAGVISAVAADQPHEIIVIDADSSDSTAETAAAAGAHVRNWRSILPAVVPVPGKGESLWRGVYAASGDIVCFVDADLTSASPGMINALTEPFSDPQVHLVKATYPRTYEGSGSGGGRVTELTAKPLLRLHFPELAAIDQPLAGEYALRTTTARQVPFVAGYGVEAGLLIDVHRLHGAHSLGQAELPPRQHRNRPLHELSPMAGTVAAVISQRAGLIGVDHPLFPGERPALERLRRAGID